MNYTKFFLMAIFFLILGNSAQAQRSHSPPRGFHNPPRGFHHPPVNYRHPHRSVGIVVDIFPFFYGPYPHYYPYSPYPPTIIIETPPPVTVAPNNQPGTPQPQYWFYCENPRGYYPNIQRCNMSWLRVIPSPPPGVP